MRENSSNKRAKENIFKNSEVVQRGWSPLDHFLLELEEKVKKGPSPLDFFLKK